MSITMMVGEERAGEPGVKRVDNCWGHETNRVSHGRGCPKTGSYDMTGALSPECLKGECWVFGPLYMETTHVGLVLNTRERNGYDDSDFYADVWNPETKAIESIEYATTRGWTYPNSATIDATPEVRAAAQEWARAKAEQAAAWAAAERAKRVEVGKEVEVVKGRKVPIGTRGRVFWVGANQFRTYYRNGYNRPDDPHNMRVGIEIATGEKVFTAYTNVATVQKEAAEAK